MLARGAFELASTSRYGAATVLFRSGHVLSRHVHGSGAAFDLRTDGGGEAEDFIERSLDQASEEGARKKDPKERSPIEVLTTRREALSLYRAVWRASFLFVWKNEKGEEWRDIIRESARKEFEAARHEKDPEMITRLLVTGRDYLDQAMEKFMTKRQSIIDGDSENSSEPGR